MSVGQSLDLSGYNLKRLSQIPKSSSFKTTAVLVLTIDDNRLSTLEGLGSYSNVVQLSVANNCLVDVKELQHLHDIVLLNLQGNSLTEIHELSHLTKLQWLSLANNSLKTWHSLGNNHLLTHLDLSNNYLKSVPDLRALTNLSTLLLSGNIVTSLQHVRLPTSLKSLSLADNDIHDINHISALSELPHLEQLSVQGNPCLAWENKSVDYRLFVLFWCNQLHSLDDSPVEDSERSLASILFPRAKCPFGVGEHSQVIQYLVQIVPHMFNMTKESPHRTNTAQDDPQSVANTHHNREDVTESFLQSTPPGSGVASVSISSDQSYVANTFWKPYTPVDSNEVSAHDKLQIIRRLNHVISDHRRKVGVNPILEGSAREDSQHQDGACPETGPTSPLVLGSTSVHIPLVPTDYRVHTMDSQQLPEDLTQLSITHSYSPEISTPLRPVTTPDDGDSYSTCTESTLSTVDSTSTHRDESSAAVTIQAWWRAVLGRKVYGQSKRRHRAATTIQSTWRGWRTRSRDPDAVMVHSVLKQKKMASYMMFCLHELKGCQEQLAHSMQVIQLQEETLHCLLQEVESLTKWRNEVDYHIRSRAATTIQRHWKGAVARRNNPGVPLLLSPVKQVVTLSKNTAIKREKETVELSVQDGVPKVEEAHERYERLGFLSQTASLDDGKHTTLNYVVQQVQRPSISNGFNLKPVPQGNPPPSTLRMSHYSPTCLLLEWDTNPCSTAIGYAIYVNGALEGTVGPGRNKAYLDGLDASASYRIFVRAVYENGESGDSNPVIASVKKIQKNVNKHSDLADSKVGDEKALNRHLLSPETLPVEEPPHTLHCQEDFTPNTRNVLSSSQDPLSVMTPSPGGSNGYAKGIVPQSVSTNPRRDSEGLELGEGSSSLQSPKDTKGGEEDKSDIVKHSATVDDRVNEDSVDNPQNQLPCVSEDGHKSDSEFDSMTSSTDSSLEDSDDSHATYDVPIDGSSLQDDEHHHSTSTHDVPVDRPSLQDDGDHHHSTSTHDVPVDRPSLQDNGDHHHSTSTHDVPVDGPSLQDDGDHHQPMSDSSSHRVPETVPVATTLPPAASTVTISSITSLNLNWDDIPGLVSILSPAEDSDHSSTLQLGEHLPPSPPKTTPISNIACSSD